MTESRQTCAAVIGLGSIGWGVATSLYGAGITTHGVDTRKEIVDKFIRKGGKGFDTPAAAAADAGVLFIFVVNAEQTESALFGEHGAVAVMQPGDVIVGCATTSPVFVEELAARVEAAGLHYIDAPVSGGRVKANEGALTIMASGKSAAFDIVELMFDEISNKVFHLGDKPGAASKVKMISQLLAGVHVASACEAIAFGIRNNIDPQTLYDVICECAGSSWMFENRVPHIIEGNYVPASSVDIFVKDLTIATSSAEATDFPTPIASAALKVFEAASEAGYGQEDDASIVKIYADQSGIKLPRSS